MTLFTIYDHDTGEVVRTGRAPNEHVARKQVREGTDVIFEMVKSTQYVADGAIVDRPIIEIPEVGFVGVAVVVQGVPADVDIKVDKTVVATSDGTALELEFGLDGEFEIEITPPFPYQCSTRKIRISPEDNP